MTINNKNPYDDQSEQHFWKTAVSQIKVGEQLFEKLNEPLAKVELGRVSSAGSCFAQHVGKWLISNGFDFLQSSLTTNQVSSFAFGNIYTPRCFLQWLTPQAENNTEYDIYHCQKVDRYFDLLRPSINSQGFTTKEELINSRSLATSELIQTLAETQTFIFTLGLTEAWKDTNDTYYPNCPGTVAGKFDDNIFKVHQFDYNEILSDMAKIKLRLKEINPQINIILTVSPVPLTATATNKHIMVASKYSKSVLRAVAGYLTDTNSDMFYFPSYELISLNSDDDFRFEVNRRTVSAKAVEYVMKHFELSLTPQKSKSEPTNCIQESANDEIECDEEKLEAYSKQTTSTSKKINKLTLIGDSHMGKLSTSFNLININVSGGMIMNGSGFAQKKFAICESEYFVPLEDAKSRHLWQSALKNLQHYESNNFKTPSIIISNIGLQTHQTVSRFVDWLKDQEDRMQNPTEIKNFVDFFYSDQREQLSILVALKDKGHEVIVVSDPPFSRYFEESKALTNLVHAYHNALKYIWSQFGITFLDAATLFESEINAPEDFTSKVTYSDGQHDWIHGNEKYYLWLAKKIIPLIDSPSN